MIRFFRYGIGILILAVLVYYMYENIDTVSFGELSRHKQAIGLSVLLLALTFLGCAYGWVLILRKMGVEALTGRALRVWLISQLGKYVPGKVWVAASRFYLFHGEQRLEVGYSLLLELVLVNITGFVFFLGSLVFWDRPLRGVDNHLVWFAILMPICLLVVHPKVLTRIVNAILHRLKKNSVEIRLRFKQMIDLSLYYLLCWAVYGMSFAALASAVTDLNLRTFVVFSGIYVLSIVIGFLTLVTPSGLGVREGVLFILLTHYMDSASATYLAIVSRIWFTFVEMGMIAGAMFWVRGESALSAF